MSAEGMKEAALHAVARVEHGMRLGLGTGRSAEAMVRALAQRCRDERLDVVGVATSVRTQQLAASLGLPLRPIAEVDALDIAFDGADEVDPQLQLTKGLGGALVRERVVAALAASFVVLVTPEKLVSRLATRAPIPVEVVPFAVAAVERALGEGGRPVLRRADDGEVYVTDNGNPIVDVHVDGGIDNPREWASRVRSLAGVIDTGLFLDMAGEVVVGTPDGVDVRTR